MSKEVKDEEVIVKEPVYKKIKVDTYNRVFLDNLLTQLFGSLFISFLYGTVFIFIYWMIQSKRNLPLNYTVVLLVVLFSAYFEILIHTSSDFAERDRKIYEKKVQIGFIECEENKNRGGKNGKRNKDKK